MIREIYALPLAHYVARVVMVEAARTIDLAPTRLRFLTTPRLIRAALPDFQRAASAEHPCFYRRLLADIVAAHLPPRANRVNPRVTEQKLPPGCGSP